MSEKQDRQGVRTATDLERKYQFGKTFAELMGIARDARDKVDSVESSLRDEIRETSTTIYRDTEKIVLEAQATTESTLRGELKETATQLSVETEQIVLSATENYTKKDEFEEFVGTYESDLAVSAKEIAMNFEVHEERIEEVDGKTQKVTEDLEKHFEFTANGLVIKAGEGSMQLLLDNDVIRFMKDGQEFGWWDGVNFHTGNIYVAVDEVAQFGNYGFVPYDDGSTDGLDLVRVGG